MLASFLFAGLIAGSALALIFVLVAGFLKWAQSPVSNDRPSSPRDTLRSDLQMSSLRIMTLALPVAILIAVPTAINRDHAASVFAAAVSFGLTFGLMAGLGAPGDVYMLVKIPLSLSGQLPWRLMKFLEDAHRLGLIRQVGPVYQFRHADLQDRLAMSTDAAAEIPFPHVPT